jgi:8-oxo-dGTP pyrophosphatase MutT (NUDIX family)
LLQHRSREPAEFFHQLQRQLRKPKPGWAAQSALLPEPRPGNIPFSQAEPFCRKAGVLLLVYIKDHCPHLLFTRRTADMLHHRGEISFPGGGRENNEELIQTATREMQEELNVAPDSYRILGRLTPLYIPPSRFCIYPFVAGVSFRPDFAPESREVKEIIEIPVSHFLDNISLRTEEWVIRNEKRVIPFFRFKENKIWGATAMVLAEMLAVLDSMFKVT